MSKIRHSAEASVGPVERAIRGASGLLSFLAGICLVLMMIQIVTDVALKFVFNAPIEGNLEIVSRYYMVGVVFLPLAMVEFRHSHINVDLFVQLLPKRGRTYVYVFSCLVAFVFFAGLAFQTALDAIHSTRVNEMIMGSIYVTVWPARWALPAGFVLVALAVLVHAYKAATRPLEFEPASSEPDVPPDTR